MELFDAAKLHDATVQTLHDRAENLAELQRGFSDACVPLMLPPATSFSEWVRRHIEKRAVDISFRDPHAETSRSAAMVVLRLRRWCTFGEMQSSLDAHFTPVDGRFVKTHTDSAPAQIVGDFEGKKNALIPELTSVTKGVGGAGCGERLSAFASLSRAGC